MDSCYYGNVDAFMPPPPPPPVQCFTFFFLSLEQTLKYFFQNIDSHNIKQHYNKRK